MVKRKEYLGVTGPTPIPTKTDKIRIVETF